MGEVCPDTVGRALRGLRALRGVRLPRRRRRRLARLVVLGLLAMLSVALSPGLAAAAPAAQPDPDTLAARVVQLTAELTAPQATVAHAAALAALALDDYQAKEADLAAAQAAAGQAADAADRAGAALAGARADLLAFARHSYISGSTSPGAASLITSADPAQLTERTVLLHAAGAYRVDALARFTAAEERA